ncbi:MAG: hypothetical protein ACP5NZ_04585 [Nanobdellota archaeon]
MGRIRNGLERALNFGRAAVVSLPLLLGTYGCEKPEPDPPQPPKDTNPPEITINSPIENKVYDSKTVSYEWLIKDKENRLDKNKSWYSLDNELTKNPITTESGSKILELENGDYNLITYAEDSSKNSTKKRIPFSIYVLPQKIIVNEFERPNKKNRNWYGSGDVDNNNTLNQNDLIRFDQVIAGTFSDPNDRRLYDRMDVNGSGGTPNGEDRKILQDKINGVAELPSEWENSNYEKRKDWFLKMKGIYKPRDIPPSPTYDCTERTNQVVIDFNLLKPDELKKFLEVNPLYDTLDNCRFNLSVDYTYITFYDANNNAQGYHAINSIVLGDRSLELKDRYFFAPETDYEINIPEEYNLYDHFEVWIRGPPVLEGYIHLQHYLTYLINKTSNNLTEINSNIDFKTDR